MPLRRAEPRPADVRPGPAEPHRYEIRIQGQLDAGWRDWFEGFDLAVAGDQATTLTGRIVDQSALHGLLRRIGDLGLTLVSINPVPRGPEGAHPR